MGWRRRGSGIGGGGGGDDNDGGFVELFDERDFPADEVRLGSIGSGYYAGESDSEDMSAITHVSTLDTP